MTKNYSTTNNNSSSNNTFYNGLLGTEKLFKKNSIVVWVKSTFFGLTGIQTIFPEIQVILFHGSRLFLFIILLSFSSCRRQFSSIRLAIIAESLLLYRGIGLPEENLYLQGPSKRLKFYYTHTLANKFSCDDARSIMTQMA